MIEHFPLVGPHNSHYQTPFCPYSFTNRNSKSLVVTVGASWTWGNFMPVNFDQVTATPEQHEYRNKHLYGNIISEHLNADFLNLSANGLGNFWEADRLKEFADLLPTLDYKKIYVVWTTTCPGKGFNGPEDQDMDYVGLIQRITNFDQVLAGMNEYAINKFITPLLNDPRVVFRTGTDCVTPIGFDSVQEYMLPSPWLFQCKETKQYKKDTYIITRYVIDRLTGLTEFFSNDTDRDQFKEWIIKLIDQAEEALSIWELPVFQQMFPDIHPVESANRQWADIILETL